jgi:hypothetical protein
MEREELTLHMKREERALQMWQVLIGAAHNRETLTYAQLADLVGMGHDGTGAVTVSSCLALLMDYCDHNNLPPITILIVNKGTGQPGAGLSTIGDLNKDREAVFNEEWFKRLPLRTEDL